MRDRSATSGCTEQVGSRVRIRVLRFSIWLVRAVAANESGRRLQHAVGDRGKYTPARDTRRAPSVGEMQGQEHVGRRGRNPTIIDRAFAQTRGGSADTLMTCEREALYLGILDNRVWVDKSKKLTSAKNQKERGKKKNNGRSQHTKSTRDVIPTRSSAAAEPGAKPAR